MALPFSFIAAEGKVWHSVAPSHVAKFAHEANFGIGTLARTADLHRSRPMGILLGFAPFIVFAVVTAAISVDLALWAALAAAFVISIRDFAQTRRLRILDVGSLLLFGLLALYTGFIQPSLPVEAVRLISDGALMSIALVSILLRNPFTLDYAREQVPREFWKAPVFIRTNYIIAAVWVAAFAAMAAADAAATFNTHFPLGLDVAASLAVLALAVVFTARYPARVRARAAARAAESPAAPQR